MSWSNLTKNIYHIKINNVCRHYVVEGPEGSPYHGGLYHGKLVFPREFPFKPPSIYMITPNGRFKCNTRLCLSISGKILIKMLFAMVIIIIRYICC